MNKLIIIGGLIILGLIGYNMMGGEKHDGMMDEMMKDGKGMMEGGVDSMKDTMKDAGKMVNDGKKMVGETVEKGAAIKDGAKNLMQDGKKVLDATGNNAGEMLDSGKKMIKTGKDTMKADLEKNMQI